jgi:hypothetical protein
MAGKNKTNCVWPAAGAFLVSVAAWRACPAAPVTHPAPAHQEVADEREATADEVPELKQQVRNAHLPTSQRLAAVLKLRKLGSRAYSAVPALASVLSEPALANAAADALADIGPDALAAIRQAAASDSPAVRRAATRAMELTIAESELVKATRAHVPCGDSYLTRLMPRDATNVQVQAARLADPDVTLRRRAAAFLTQSHASAVMVLPALARAAGNEQDPWASEWVEQTFNTALAEGLPIAVHHENGRQKLVHLLITVASAAAAKPELASAALAALARPELRADEASPVFFAHRSDGHHEAAIRAALAAALSRGAPSATAPFVEMLRDHDSQVRQFATHALAKAGEHALPVLHLAMQSDDASTRQSALRLLKDNPSADQAAVSDALKLLSDPMPEVRRDAVQTLRAMLTDRPALATADRDLPELVPALVSAAGDSDRLVKEPATALLKRLRPELVLPKPNPMPAPAVAANPSTSQPQGQSVFMWMAGILGVLVTGVVVGITIRRRTMPTEPPRVLAAAAPTPQQKAA